MNELIELLRKLERDCFYGSLEVKFESGHISIVRKTENMKLGTTQNYRNSRGDDRERNQQ